MDRLPPLFALGRQRQLALARRELLAGRMHQAKAVLRAFSHCGQTAESNALQQIADGGRTETQQDEVTADSKETLHRTGAREAKAADPLALRIAIWRRLRAAIEQGLLPHALARQSAEALLRAIRAAKRTAKSRSFSPEWVLNRRPEQLQRSNASTTQETGAVLASFDRALARTLAKGLQPGTPIKPLALNWAQFSSIQPAVDNVLIQRELDARLAYAARALEPRYVAADALAPRWPTGLALTLLRPRFSSSSTTEGHVRDAQVIAQLTQRLGFGWLHLGLPPGPYQVAPTDHSAEYWRQRTNQAEDMDALRALAMEQLEQEVARPDGHEAVGHAAVALVALQGQAALQLLLRFDALPPELIATRLDALCEVQSERINALIKGSLKAPDGSVRAAALRCATARQLIGTAELRAALSDPDHAVAATALARLLLRGEPQATRLAVRWLATRGREHAMMLDILSRLSLAGAPARKLHQTLRTLLAGSPSSAVVAALANLQPANDRWLLQAYDSNPSLRAQLLGLARPVTVRPLLDRALSTTDQPTRRAAAARLSGLAVAADRPLLRRLVRDPDPFVAAAGQLASWKLGDADALLQLGQATRADCQCYGLVLGPLAEALDPVSRRALLLAALRRPCGGLAAQAWDLIKAHQWYEPSLYRAALGHGSRTLRVRAATALLQTGQQGHMASFGPAAAGQTARIRMKVTQ